MNQITVTPPDAEYRLHVQVSDYDYLADAAWYADYRRIKFEVFGSELGWPVGGSSNERMASVDPFDPVASFSVMCHPGAGPIGTVRGCRVVHGFPHEDLFAVHLRNEGFCSAIPCLCTLNALAVLPGFRGRGCADEVRGWRGSAGRLLVLSQLRHHSRAGVEGAILTAGGSRPARFFARLGFRPLGPPQATSLHSGRLMNMALWFHSASYRKALLDAGIESANPVAAPAIAAFAEYVMGMGLDTNTDAYDW